MTKRQNKVRRHPTFTIGELKAADYIDGIAS